MHDNREKEWIVLKIGGKWPSKITTGKCVTIVARNMKSGVSFRTWPDTTFKSWDWWKVLKVGDIFTDVSIFDKHRRILSATNFPRVSGHIDLETGEINPSKKQNKESIPVLKGQTSMFDGEDVKEETTSDSQ